MVAAEAVAVTEVPAGCAPRCRVAMLGDLAARQVEAVISSRADGQTHGKHFWGSRP